MIQRTIAELLVMFVARQWMAIRISMAAEMAEYGCLATSCQLAAQMEFDRAVALLHSFQFSAAIQGFNGALKADPKCGIAYWGIALSQWSNPFAVGMKDTGQLQSGREGAERGKAIAVETSANRRTSPPLPSCTTFREHCSTSAFDCVSRRYGELAARNPEDHEAQIFYALAIAASEGPADKTYAGR